MLQFEFLYVKIFKPNQLNIKRAIFTLKGINEVWTNKVGKVLKIFGVAIIILGIIASIILAVVFPAQIYEEKNTVLYHGLGVETTFNFVYLIFGIFMSVTAGMLLIGVAEIIKLLQIIVDDGKSNSYKKQNTEINCLQENWKCRACGSNNPKSSICCKNCGNYK